MLPQITLFTAWDDKRAGGFVDDIQLCLWDAGFDIAATPLASAQVRTGLEAVRPGRLVRLQGAVVASALDCLAALFPAHFPPAIVCSDAEFAAIDAELGVNCRLPVLLRQENFDCPAIARYPEKYFIKGAASRTLCLGTEDYFRYLVCQSLPSGRYVEPIYAFVGLEAIAEDTPRPPNLASRNDEIAPHNAPLHSVFLFEITDAENLTQLSCAFASAAGARRFLHLRGVLGRYVLGELVAIESMY